MVEKPAPHQQRDDTESLPLPRLVTKAVANSRSALGMSRRWDPILSFFEYAGSLGCEMHTRCGQADYDREYEEFSVVTDSYSFFPRDSKITFLLTNFIKQPGKILRTRLTGELGDLGHFCFRGTMETDLRQKVTQSAHNAFLIVDGNNLSHANPTQ